MDERRKEIRRKLMAFTPVYDLHPRVLLGYLGDLTVRGALIVGKTLTTIHKETTLQINFPLELSDISPIIIPARIAWCRSDESQQYYNIGVEFTEGATVYEELFKAILERYRFRHPFADIDDEPG
jgi:hypothetical protein